MTLTYAEMAALVQTPRARLVAAATPGILEVFVTMMSMNVPIKCARTLQSVIITWVATLARVQLAGQDITVMRMSKSVMHNPA